MFEILEAESALATLGSCEPINPAKINKAHATIQWLFPEIKDIQL